MQCLPLQFQGNLRPGLRVPVPFQHPQHQIVHGVVQAVPVLHRQIAQGVVNPVSVHGDHILLGFLISEIVISRAGVDVVVIGVQGYPLLRNNPELHVNLDAVGEGGLDGETRFSLGRFRCLGGNRRHVFLQIVFLLPVQFAFGLTGKIFLVPHAEGMNPAGGQARRQRRRQNQNPHSVPMGSLGPGQGVGDKILVQVVNGFQKPFIGFHSNPSFFRWFCSLFRVRLRVDLTLLSEKSYCSAISRMGYRCQYRRTNSRRWV